MSKQISKFSIHQSSKIWAFVTFLSTCIFIIPVILFLLYYHKDASFLGMLIFPFINFAISYVVTAYFLWLYNLIAGSFGGIEFQVEEKE